MLKKQVFLSLFAALLLVLGACSNNNDGNKETTEDTESTENAESPEEDKGNTEDNENMEDMDHGDMNHSSSGKVPEGLKVAENPTFEVGSQAILETDHMKGMKGAKATIVGAYDTTVYSVSYTPTTGGERVENHKWVIHEEIKNAGEEPFEPGAEVTLEANHMKGMEGATAEIDTAKKMTVYMVDYTPTTGGEKVKNHKWVTESELSPVE